jgi:hypothetical protein
VLGWKKLGLERSLGSRIVTYADDLVILCRKGKAELASRDVVYEGLPESARSGAVGEAKR